MTDADLCHKNGWKPGTRLVGDEGYGPTVIEITAVGEECVLARLIADNGVARNGFETLWDLYGRDWKEDAP